MTTLDPSSLAQLLQSLTMVRDRAEELFGVGNDWTKRLEAMIADVEAWPEKEAREAKWREVQTHASIVLQRSGDALTAPSEDRCRLARFLHAPDGGAWFRVEMLAPCDGAFATVNVLDGSDLWLEVIAAETHLDVYVRRPGGERFDFTIRVNVTGHAFPVAPERDREREERLVAELLSPEFVMVMRSSLAMTWAIDIDNAYDDAEREDAARTDDNLADTPCENCGSFAVRNNAACGDPECCGPNFDYCADCDEQR